MSDTLLKADGRAFVLVMNDSSVKIFPDMMIALESLEITFSKIGKISRRSLGREINFILNDEKVVGVGSYADSYSGRAHL